MFWVVEQKEIEQEVIHEKVLEEEETHPLF